MAEQRIKPELITRPIQLLAAWLAGLVLIDGLFLTAAAAISAPTWVTSALVLAAIANVPIFLTAIFVLQTRFRAELQDDPHYSEYLERQQKTAERQAEQLNEELAAQIQLADSRVDLTVDYVTSVISSLGVDARELERLQRALRESARATEDRFTQRIRSELLSTLEASFAKDVTPGRLRISLLDELAQHQYKHILQTSQELLQGGSSAVGIGDSVARVTRALETLAASRGARLEVSIQPPDLTATVSRTLLEMCLHEVLINAIRYGVHDSPITISARREDSRLTNVEVVNYIGDTKIPDTALLVEAGFRGEAAMRANLAGTGLGLFVCNRAMRTVGGRLELATQDGRFVVTMALPSAEA